MAAAPAAASSADRPRSLSEWLRGRSDAQLVTLLQRRPDLALPAPADLATLAGRLGVRSSVQRALDGLDAFSVAVVEAAVLATEAVLAAEPGGHDGARHSFSRDALLPLLGAVDPQALNSAIDGLLELGLLWGAPDALHMVGSVREALGPYPAGLGRPAARLVRPVPDVLADPDLLCRALDELTDDQQHVVHRLAAGPPVATLRRGGGSPGATLVARGLLVPLDGQTVELPREVGLAVRPAPLGEVSTSAPAIRTTSRGPAELDRGGTTAVLEAVRLVQRLGELWTAAPPAQLRSSFGIGVRELRRTAKDLAVDEPTAALIIEVAAAASLVNVTPGLEPVYLPTPDFDAWLDRSTAARWTDLSVAWLAMTRQPSLVGQRDERERVISALGVEVERGTVPVLRRTLLSMLAQLPPGATPTERADVLARLQWQAPRRGVGQRPIAEAVLAEADRLGFTLAGGLTGYSRTLLAGSRADAERVLDDALPAPVDHFLVQPDLTVVVPGPPTAELATELGLFADLESTGGASVYRISEPTIRRALDVGRTGDQIAAIIAGRSRTPVPQSLSYLIDDLSRRHGNLRSGAATSYLRSDDEALLSRVLADKASASLHLNRIAPTVVISGAPVARVLEVLRKAGYAPAAEGAAGEVISLGEEPARAPTRPPSRPFHTRTAADTLAQLRELVRRVRAGDALSELARHNPALADPVPGVTSASIMGALREAIRSGRRVMVGVAEADGSASRHMLLPISLGGGYVRGHESGRPGLVAYPLHRITAVRAVQDDAES